MSKSISLAIVLLLLAQPALAQTAATGSESVLIDGQSAQSVGDTTASGGVVVEGSPDVFINGKPAVTAGSSGSCGNGVVVGSPSVFINGKPAAVAGSGGAPCE